jgi:putative ABC transport system permease protein
MVFFDFARRNIRLHWLRSLLAVIGIIIGVIAISTLGILGNSLVLSISETISDVGDTVIVTPHAGTMPGERQGGPPQSSIAGTGMTISEQDLERITRAAGVNVVIPVLQGSDRISYGNDDGAATVYGMNTEDIPVLLELESGIYPRRSSGCLAGSGLAEEFGIRAGNRIEIGRAEAENMRVTGIVRERGLGFDINPDNAVIISSALYRELYPGDGYTMVIVKVRDVNDIGSVKASIENALNRRETVVDVMDTRMILDSLFEVFDQIVIFTLAIGGISLVVAGVAILNVMLMSVNERTREIGVMRSIGTRRREVLRMFLYEALILGFAGSVVGGVLSLGGGYLVNAIVLERPDFLFVPSSLVYILYGMVFGVMTSVASGIYPAWKAANLNPIEALRYE